MNVFLKYLTFFYLKNKKKNNFNKTFIEFIIN